MVWRGCWWCFSSSSVLAPSREGLWLYASADSINAIACFSSWLRPIQAFSNSLPQPKAGGSGRVCAGVAQRS